MGLFSRNKPVVFEPHGYRRHRRWGIPRWAVLLLSGIVIGAGGLFYVQEEYLPPRLSPLESRQLQTRVQQLEDERAHFKGSLEQTQEQLQKSEADVAGLTTELTTAQARIVSLQQDITLFEEVLPPDPRNGAISVRAARFQGRDGELEYHVLLTREARAGKNFRGVIEFAVAGTRAGGAQATVDLEPIRTDLASYEHLQGRVALPAGFAPRQVTVRVREAPGGSQLGMRVLNVH